MLSERLTLLYPLYIFLGKTRKMGTSENGLPYKCNQLAKQTTTSASFEDSPCLTSHLSAEILHIHRGPCLKSCSSEKFLLPVSLCSKAEKLIQHNKGRKSKFRQSNDTPRGCHLKRDSLYSWSVLFIVNRGFPEACGSA